jgi:hypothetical protein
MVVFTPFHFGPQMHLSLTAFRCNPKFMTHSRLGMSLRHRKQGKGLQAVPKIFCSRRRRYCDFRGEGGYITSKDNDGHGPRLQNKRDCRDRGGQLSARFGSGDAMSSPSTYKHVQHSDQNRAELVESPFHRLN